MTVRQRIGRLLSGVRYGSVQGGACAGATAGATATYKLAAGSAVGDNRPGVVLVSAILRAFRPISELGPIALGQTLTGAAFWGEFSDTFQTRQLRGYRSLFVARGPWVLRASEELNTADYLVLVQWHECYRQTLGLEGYSAITDAPRVGDPPARYIPPCALRGPDTTYIEPDGAGGIFVVATPRLGVANGLQNLSPVTVPPRALAILPDLDDTEAPQDWGFEVY